MGNCVMLDAGSGGRASQRLINQIFLRHFDNEILAKMDDAAILASKSQKLSISTDSYTVSPLFFLGGSIGTLAINGTVNDVAMAGAKPLWLTAAFIIEEGLPLETLEAVVLDMAEAAQRAGVRVVSGDTKVVPKGACDKLFINTTGVGEIYSDISPSGSLAQIGDAVLVSGAMGDHGLAVMAAREDITFLSEVRSDCAPLNQMIARIIERAGMPHVLRDPTRGGLATTLNEIAQQSQVGIIIEEKTIPVHNLVIDGCSFLGLDPLYLANEGKVICILPKSCAEAALSAMREFSHGEEAALIGEIVSAHPEKVSMQTKIGGKRFLGMLEGAQLPRIC